MNARGAHFFIGLFVVAGIVAIFAAGLWLAGAERSEETLSYEIRFEGSVSGLSVGSRVSYRGIRIGSVSGIGIKPDNPQIVQVFISVFNQFALRTGDVASLGLEGITGNAYITIEGAVPGSTLIETAADRPGLIPSRQSELEQLAQGVPELVTQITALVNRAGALLTQENRQQISETIANINTITTTVAAERDNLTAAITGVNEAAAEVVRLSTGLRELTERLAPVIDDVGVTAAGARAVLRDETPALLREWRLAAASLTQLTESAHTIVSANEESLGYFSNEGLYEFTLFIQEARLLIASITRVVDQLEASGARFLLDQQHPEIDPN